jgi:hypothetical protein
MRLTEIPVPLADPTASSWGAAQGGFLLVTFLCRSKKSDSRVARNALASKHKQKPEQDQEHPSSILPCAARRGGGRSKSKCRSKSKSRININIKMDPSFRWDDGIKKPRIAGLF